VSSPSILIFSIEGGEGAGKSSLIRHLTRVLSSLDIPHIFTREPGGTPFCEDVRRLLLNSPSAQGINPISELLLFLSSRLEHVEKIIEPALSAGVSVLCDRFVDSTMAYQAYGREFDPDRIWQLSTSIVPLLPDITFYLDLAPEIADKRLDKRQQSVRDRLESEERRFHERVRRGYLAMAERCPDRIRVLDASLSEEEVAGQAQTVLTQWLKDHRCI